MSDVWREDKLIPDPLVLIERDGVRFVVPESVLPDWLTNRMAKFAQRADAEGSAPEGSDGVCG